MHRTSGVSSRRRLGLAGLLLCALVVVACVAGVARAAGSSGQITLSPSQVAKARQSFLNPGEHYIQGSDWLLAMWNISQLRANPPDVPVIYMLGGSAARECTVTDDDWAQEIAGLGGPNVICRNLGSRNQTFGQDVNVVKNLPEVPSIVFIGINPSRYFFGPMDASVHLPPASSPRPKGTQHHYSSNKIYSLATKKALVGSVNAKFSARYGYNNAVLGQILAACKSRPWLHPVLVDMPRLMSLIGHTWDGPIATYHKGAWNYRVKYGTPFLNFVGKCHFVPNDFFDLVHLVNPGRPKFQRQLSGYTLQLLRSYKMAPPKGS